jgi:hypothetical protein
LNWIDRFSVGHRQKPPYMVMELCLVRWSFHWILWSSKKRSQFCSECLPIYHIGFFAELLFWILICWLTFNYHWEEILVWAKQSMETCDGSKVEQLLTCPDKNRNKQWFHSVNWDVTVTSAKTSLSLAMNDDVCYSWTVREKIVGINSNALIIINHIIHQQLLPCLIHVTL